MDKTIDSRGRNIVIGVDIDNTIAATDKIIRALIKQYFNLKASKEDILSWDYSDSLRITPEQEEFIFDEFHKHCLSELKVISGARLVLRILSEHYNIWLLTSRPSFTKSQTKEWLKENSIQYDQIFFLQQKSFLHSDISYLIDDKAETALDFATKGVRVFLLDYPWNRAVLHPLIRRTYNWNQILDIFNQEILSKNF